MEQQLKQRLVGAVVLVSLAVIFIPFILEGPGDEWTPRSQTIPQPPALDFRTSMELPLPEAEDETVPGPVATTAGRSEAAPAQADSSADVRAVPVPVRQEPEPIPLPAQASVKATSPEQPAASTLADGWYAQVGSFSQQQNAAGLRERLDKSGYKAHVQQADTAAGSSFRVLVGPEQGRERAEQMLQKLTRELQLKGIVIELSAASG